MTQRRHGTIQLPGLVAAALWLVACGDKGGAMDGSGGQGSGGTSGATGTGGNGPGGGAAVGSGGQASSTGVGTGGKGSGGVTSSGGTSPGSGGATGTGGEAGRGGRFGMGGRPAAGSGGVGTGGTVTGSGGAGGGTTGAGAGGASSSAGCGKATLPAACDTSAKGACTINVGGTDRQYFAVLPANYDPNRPYPIVFLWHGASTVAQQYIGGGFIAYYGIRTSLPNAIYVAAQGLPSTAGGTDYGWANTNGQDVAFTKAMIDSLESNYCVDKSRLYSSGFSYGGIMSLTLACQMPDVFRAIGVMSGTMFGGANGCLKNPIPGWFTHGDADATLNISGGESARDAMIKRNGCDANSTKTAMMSDGKTVCTIYDVCTSGNFPVVWCPVPGGTHSVPSFSGPEIAKFFTQF